VSDDLPNVSRETLGELQDFAELVVHWNRTINLVAKSDDVWGRHIVDCAKLLDGVGRVRGRWVDLGSGGGFPGVVIGILARSRGLPLRVTLVEADRRKAEFLRHAAHRFGLEIEVRHERIEVLEPQGADVVSARALAPLDVLLGYVARHLAAGGLAVLPKGTKLEDEVAAARKLWSFDVDVISAAFGGSVLHVRNVGRLRND
jgi:16S rRNA (guanine527-N7)-methyltransferase